MEHDTSHHKRKDENFSFDDQQAGFVMGAVVGALVGGAAALLLSPKNGKEMREIVKKYSKDLELEAYELAKDARGTANSFRGVLQEGATEVLEQAPEKLEQTGYQAQQLADELSQRFESARDVVAELAEAFRSGWEEYGEDQPEDELRAAPSLLSDDELPEVVRPMEQVAVVEKAQDDVEEEPEEDESPHVAPLQARRRTHGGSHYSMHSSPAVDDESEVVKPAPHARRESEKEEEPKPKRPTEAPGYTTRVLDEPKKVEPVKSKLRTEDAPAKKSAEAKKKLLFRRAAK